MNVIRTSFAMQRARRIMRPRDPRMLGHHTNSFIASVQGSDYVLIERLGSISTDDGGLTEDTFERLFAFPIYPQSTTRSSPAS